MVRESLGTPGSGFGLWFWVWFWLGLLHLIHIQDLFRQVFFLWDTSLLLVAVTILVVAYVQHMW